VSDYYEILGVSRQATTDEIRRAYKKKARKLHPDVAGPGHEDEFKAVNAAYEVLADSDKRQMYDLGGEDAVTGGFGAGGFSASDLGGFGDFLQQATGNGGAADVFVSAAQKQMNALDEKKLLADGTRVDLLINDVVLITAKDSKLNLPDFKAVLDPQVAHIALGEPKGVPVGQYSEEVFTKLGILDDVKARAVYGSDVRQVLAWVETGDADCGVVYATDAAISDKVKVAAVAPADTHKPIVYPAAVLKDAKNMNEAKDFLAFLQTDAAKKVFEKYGFKVK